MAKDGLFSYGAGKMISKCKIMKLDSYLKPYTRINSTWIKGLNLKAKTIKLLEENRGESLHDFGFGNDSLDVTPEALTTKENRYVGLHD